MRRRTRRAYRALLWLLLAVLLAAACVAGLHLWRLARDKARAERLLWEMRQTALAAPGGAPLEAAFGGGGGGGRVPGPSSAPASGAGEAPLPEPSPAPAPGEAGGAQAGEEMPGHLCPVDFDALRAGYPGVAAWLVGCGGAIDTPVMQGADNLYYLEHLPDGTRNRLGAAFLDSANSPLFTDDQSFLFGHHMDSGDGVFSPLLNYQDAAYWREAPNFILHTPDGCYLAEVFAAFVIQERAYPYEREFASANAMRTFLNEVCARSQIETPVRPAPGDRILTLCTCTSKTNDLRYVVCTRLAPLANAQTQQKPEG